MRYIRTNIEQLYSASCTFHCNNVTITSYKIYRFFNISNNFTSSMQSYTSASEIMEKNAQYCIQFGYLQYKVPECLPSNYALEQTRTQNSFFPVLTNFHIVKRNRFSFLSHRWQSGKEQGVRERSVAPAKKKCKIANSSAFLFLTQDR